MRLPLPASKQLLRGSLVSRPSNGHVAFIPQIRKIVFEYCDTWASSSNTRTYLYKQLVSLAEQNPHVEFVVKQRNQKEPIARGFYLNDKEKVIPLQGFEVTGIHKKVELLLESSGAAIKPLKKTVMSTTEATRGIWSGMHDQPFKI